MNTVVDIGNTRLKCGIFHPNGDNEVNIVPLQCWQKGIFLHPVLHWDLLSEAELLTADIYPDPFTWRIALTGSFPWEKMRTEILKVRPKDKFEIIVREQIPLKLAVDSPDKVGIDRLLAACAAVHKYGDSPMLIVDAGSAITVDVVQNRTFCGGAILPGLHALSKTYPQLSEKLPLVPIPVPKFTACPNYPGGNTQEAILNGLYWSTVGAIRQFYDMTFPKKGAGKLILTGGDADSLLPGLSQVVSSRRIKHHDMLVLEGINLC
jgi:type III pantothenate kinase